MPACISHLVLTLTLTLTLLIRFSKVYEGETILTWKGSAARAASSEAPRRNDCCAVDFTPCHRLRDHLANRRYLQTPQTADDHFKRRRGSRRCQRDNQSL